MQTAPGLDLNLTNYTYDPSTVHIVAHVENFDIALGLLFFIAVMLGLLVAFKIGRVVFGWNW